MTKFRSLVGRVGSFVRSMRSARRSNEELEHTHRKAREKDRQLEKLRNQLEQKDRELIELRVELAGKSRVEPGGVKPENVVWIFGAGRTGSTWLATIMDELKNQQVWFEPQVGGLFDPDRLEIGIHRGWHFIFSSHYKKSWLESVRNFVLDGAAVRFPEQDKMLIVKEPHGSAGAPLLIEALPESRMILLVRDPRDTIASALDAFTRGIWKGEVWKGMYGGSGESPDAFVREAAYSYLRHVGNARQAYNAHEGRKVLIRYEDLRANTVGCMRRIYTELDIQVDQTELMQAVEKHSWEKLPEDKKGRGKFYRKASPGSWKEDLTREQVTLVEDITRPIIEEFYQV